MTFHRITICIAAVFTLAVGVAASPGDSRIETYKTISAIYAKSDNAARARDVAGTLALDTAGYQIVNAKGKVLFTNGPKMVAQWRKTYEGATQVRQKTTLQTLTLQSGSATATILQRLQLSAIDPNINNWRTWVIDWKMEDTWIRAGSVWKRKRTIMLAQTSSKRVGAVE